MIFHWLRDNENFRIYWDKGPNNDADYFTKDHTYKHHNNMKPTYTRKGFLMKRDKKLHKFL